ncbi:MAG TPA: RidA family protein [Streptosporangiaceae bacterium]|nr:RidA family protein [Streptosporangiaceae bacterium]
MPETEESPVRGTASEIDPAPLRTRRVASGAAWEPVVGYSRAVAAGDYIFVSGCTSIAGAEFVHPDDAYAQTAQALANVEAALAVLGASLADVVRTRMFVTDIGRWEEYGRAHGEAFADVMPATSMIQIGALIDPRMLVEVEAVAYKPGAGACPAAGSVPEAGLL